jgi:hypothetical protein
MMEGFAPVSIATGLATALERSSRARLNREEAPVAFSRRFESDCGTERSRDIRDYRDAEVSYC